MLRGSAGPATRTRSWDCRPAWTSIDTMSRRLSRPGGSLLRGWGRPGAGHPLRWSIGRQQFHRLQPRRLLDAFRSGRLVLRCHPSGTFTTSAVPQIGACRHSRRPVRGSQLHSRADIPSSSPVDIYRTAGATGFPEHPHQRRQRHRRTNPLYGRQLARGTDRRPVWPDMVD